MREIVGSRRERVGQPKRHSRGRTWLEKARQRVDPEGTDVDFAPWSMIPCGALGRPSSKMWASCYRVPPVHAVRWLTDVQFPGCPGSGWLTMAPFAMLCYVTNCEPVNHGNRRSLVVGASRCLFS